jgi:hypothetical protein
MKTTIFIIKQFLVVVTCFIVFGNFAKADYAPCPNGGTLVGQFCEKSSPGVNQCPHPWGLADTAAVNPCWNATISISGGNCVFRVPIQGFCTSIGARSIYDCSNNGVSYVDYIPTCTKITKSAPCPNGGTLNAAGTSCVVPAGTCGAISGMTFADYSAWLAYAQVKLDSDFCSSGALLPPDGATPDSLNRVGWKCATTACYAYLTPPSVGAACGAAGNTPQKIGISLADFSAQTNLCAAGSYLSGGNPFAISYGAFFWCCSDRKNAFYCLDSGHGVPCASPGICGSANGTIQTTLPKSWSTETCLVGSGSAYDSWVLNPKGPWTWQCQTMANAPIATCSTASAPIPPAACPVVNYTSTAANPCPSGGTPSGGNCVTTSTYAATLSYSCLGGGTLSGANCINSSSAAAAKSCTATYACGLGNYDGMEIHGTSCFTVCHAQFGCTIPNIVAAMNNSLGSGTSCYNPSSGTPIVYTCPSGTTPSGTNCITSLSSPATPSYSCNSGDGAPVGQTCTTTSSYPATTNTYSCSNVCSSTFSNTQGSFTASDAACTTPTSSVTYSLNCNCGVKALPAKAPINESSCTACTQAGQPPAPQAGICGTANGTDVTTLAATDAGLCQNGSVDLFTGSGPWTWNCKGNWGGSSVACGATKKCIPNFNYICALIPTGTCDDTNVGKKIVAQTPACNSVGTNACSVGGIASLDECAAAGVSCPAPVEKVCQAPLSVTNWKEVAPR